MALTAASAEAGTVRHFIRIPEQGCVLRPAPPLAGVVALDLLRGLRFGPWTPLKAAVAGVWVQFAANLSPSNHSGSHTEAEENTGRGATGESG